MLNSKKTRTSPFVPSELLFLRHFLQNTMSFMLGGNRFDLLSGMPLTTESLRFFRFMCLDNPLPRYQIRWYVTNAEILIHHEMVTCVPGEEVQTCLEPEEYLNKPLPVGENCCLFLHFRFRVFLVVFVCFVASWQKHHLFSTLFCSLEETFAAIGNARRPECSPATNLSSAKTTTWIRGLGNLAFPATSSFLKSR